MAEIAVQLAISAGEKLIGSTAGKLYAGISKEVSRSVGVCKEMQDIIDELRILGAFMRDTEKKQLDNETARAWVEQMRHLSYDFEDCIEDFSLHFDHHRRVNPLRALGARHRIAVRIQSIKSRVKEVRSRGMDYGITSIVNRADDYAVNTVVSQHDPRLSALFIENSQLVGIDGPCEKLVGWLLNETERELGLIAVVGEGGIGKTTIVKKAYESPKATNERFKCLAWISVSQMYNVDVILRDLFKQLIQADPKENPEYLNMGRKQVTEKLRGYLQDKSYIVVFDDVWTIDAWKSLELALPKNELGSRILLTTRNQEVAEVACASQTHHHIYRHEKLSADQSMDLFLRRVFKNSTSCLDDIKTLAEAILEKCDGLPLAIVSIAGVLASKPNKSSREEWEKLRRQLGSELEHNPNLADVKHILTLSYNDLPYNVRHCFLYLSKFPEDCSIERKRIQMLWVAEGFVSDRPDMSAEEVAESYFNELANRFMILPSSFSSVDGKVKSFIIHDIMLELIMQKSREENFISLIREKSGWPSENVIRRLSVQYTNDELEQDTTNPSHIRSLTMYRDGLMLNLISPSVGLLRVLDLDGCDALRDGHLPAISELIHLRYLSLRGTEVLKLPNCWGSLKKLETLDIRGTWISTLPKRITELQKLRHLLSSRMRFPLKIPRGIGMMRALQTLSIDAESSGKKAMKELGKLTQLRKLNVKHLKEEKMKDFCNSLNAMCSTLHSLRVNGSHVSEPDLSIGLNNLSCPPLLLQSLGLYHFLIKEIPSWVFSLNNLLKLQIYCCQLEEGALESLGKLPNLIRLTLGDDSPREHMISLSFGAQRFLRLKDLSLHCSDTVASISFQEGVMPHLESFELRSRHGPCWMKISGITNLACLQQLTTNNPRVRDEVEPQLAHHPNQPRLLFGS